MTQHSDEYVKALEDVAEAANMVKKNVETAGNVRWDAQGKLVQAVRDLDAIRQREANPMGLPWNAAKAKENTYMIRDKNGRALCHGLSLNAVNHILDCVNNYTPAVKALVEAALEWDNVRLTPNPNGITHGQERLKKTAEAVRKERENGHE